MRNVVDHTLHATLEKRLGESFKLVSERLELVHKGLGEMSSLASGVGDLKKVLTNVKTRGTWGEIQLENLEQILTKEQYATNVQTKPGTQDRVEFAIRMPGQSHERKEVWLPIDAKFPIEIYSRIQEAYEKADAGMVEEFSKQTESQIRGEAKKIREKYLEPPFTTDFGIMYIPIEGLFAEIVRRPGLLEKLPGEEKTFKELFLKYLTEYSARNKAQTTQTRDKSLADHLIKFFGEYILTEISPKQISLYKSGRREEKAVPKTINNELILMSHAFNLAIKEWEWVKENPVSKVSKEKVNNQIERWLTLDEEEKLMMVFPTWLREITVLAIHTGLRQSEILNLQWPQVDLFRKTMTILVRKTKVKTRYH